MNRIAGVGILAIALVAVPLAATTEARQEAPAVEQIEGAATTETTQCAGVPDTTPEPTFLSTSCTARCTEGPDVTCTGSSCIATDQACPGTGGLCFSPEEGFKTCAACPYPLPCPGGVCGPLFP